MIVYPVLSEYPNGTGKSGKVCGIVWKPLCDYQMVKVSCKGITRMEPILIPIRRHWYSRLSRFRLFLTQTFEFASTDPIRVEFVNKYAKADITAIRLYYIDSSTHVGGCL